MLLYPENSNIDILDMDSARQKASEREFVIGLLRVGLTPPQLQTPIWAATHTLVSSAVVPLMRVGFLPVIPKPITDPAVVRQVLTNFENIRKQLKQPSFVIWCDEAVFALACELVISEPEVSGNFASMHGTISLGT